MKNNNRKTTTIYNSRVATREARRIAKADILVDCKGDSPFSRYFFTYNPTSVIDRFFQPLEVVSIDNLIDKI